MRIEGGCLCGKVRYSAEAEPAFVGICHCKNCQRETGTAFATVVAVPKSAVTVQGMLKSYADKADSGRVLTRLFCPECGSSVFDESATGTFMILAGTLDDPGWIRPGVEIFCDSAQPWVSLGGERKRFAGMPG